MSNSDAPLFVGVDGGGTHTRVAIVDSSGAILGEGRGGVGNYQAVGIEEVARSIDAALTEAWQRLGSPRKPARAAFLGMAGVVTPHDRAAISRIAETLKLAETIEVDHDIRIALAGGIGCREGVALIAGTGSSCYGRRSDGRNHRAGGWGHLVDDGGSGYRLVLDGIAAALRAYDGRGPDTTLHDILFERLGAADPNDILRLLGSDIPERAELAALAPDVIAAAEQGDDVAFEVVTHGAEELARMVEAVVRSLADPDGADWPAAELVIAGGVATAPFYREEITHATTRRIPSVVPREALLSAALGAALLAMESLGGKVTEDILERLSLQ